ncbi:MAG TPA: PqiC family protein [Desulfuromonadales bacterium]
MMRRSCPLYTALCAVLLLGLSACGSSPAVHFYTLTSLQEGKSSPAIEMAERQGIIAVGPVEIADYLNRPQIVRRDGASSVTLLEVDRWAGSLQGDVARVLLDNLAVLLGPSGYVVLPWETSPLADGRIQVSVTRFEGTDQDTVVLDALWTLNGKEKGDILAAGNTVIVEPAGGGGAGGMVEAMNRALAELSRRIAAEAETKLGQAG